MTSTTGKAQDPTKVCDELAEADLEKVTGGEIDANSASSKDKIAASDLRMKSGK